MKHPILVTGRQFYTLGACVILLLAGQAFGQTRQDVARATFASTVTILVFDTANQPLGLGSGFAIGGDLIATNAHVIAGASTVRVRPIDAPIEFPATTVVQFDADTDLAILRVPGLTLTALPQQSQSEPVVGDTIYAVGSPQGLEGTFSAGIVSAIRDLEGQRLIQITAPISPGSSGGPVLDEGGRVIGIAVGTFSNGQNLNFAIPITALVDLQARPAEDRPIASLAEDRALAGGEAAAGSDLSQAVQLSAVLMESRGGFSFSVRNLLDRPISNVTLFIAFYDATGFPLDTARVRVAEVIPPNLGVRATGQVHPSVQSVLSTSAGFSRVDDFVTYRVLDFGFATDEELRGDVIRVQPGDSLWSLARRHDTTVAALMAANDLTADDVVPGQVLRLP